ncbi:MAG: hypothetical protein R3Y21_01830 [Mycoplasmatota bacterium]
MYNIDYSNLKKNYKFYAPFLIAGVILFVIFVMVSVTPIVKKFSFSGETTASEVYIIPTIDDEGSLMYNVTYEYVVDGSTYFCKPSYTSSSSNGMEEKNTVYYDVDDPTNCVTEYDYSLGIIDLLLFILTFAFLYVSITHIIKTNKKIKKVKYLANHGKLVKGLKYELIFTGQTVNEQKIYCILINYEINGDVISLKGDPRYDFKSRDSDELVDLLIDPNDPTNYYIDFEIR